MPKRTLSIKNYFDVFVQGSLDSQGFFEQIGKLGHEMGGAFKKAQDGVTFDGTKYSMQVSPELQKDVDKGQAIIEWVAKAWKVVAGKRIIFREPTCKTGWVRLYHYARSDRKQHEKQRFFRTSFHKGWMHMKEIREMIEKFKNHEIYPYEVWTKSYPVSDTVVVDAKTIKTIKPPSGYNPNTGQSGQSNGGNASHQGSGQSHGGHNSTYPGNGGGNDNEKGDLFGGYIDDKIVKIAISVVIAVLLINKIK